MESKAMTPAERKRKQREKDKAQAGMIPYSCKIHKDDKKKIDAFVRKLNNARAV